MKIADFLMPLFLSVLTVWAINYFFLGDRTQNAAKAGQEFLAPTSMQAIKPLNLEIDFIDKDLQSQRQPTKTIVDTSYAQFEFNDNGATLENLAFKRNIGGKEQLLSTITTSTTQIGREGQAFLVAFNNNTPYLYKLIEETENDQLIKLSYKADTDSATILKTFKIYKDKCQIDFDLEITPKRNSTLQARIIVPTPYLQDAEVYSPAVFKQSPLSGNVFNGLVFSEKDTLKKTNLSNLYNKFWANPALFGAEDKFFIHTLFKDSQNFVERGYYKFVEANKALIIYEGPEFNTKSSWNFSFYLGPKESGAISKVDTKLEQTLDYGWLAPISKILLYILKWLYKYLHNYGFAIIALTLLLKLLFAPFTIDPVKAEVRKKELSKKMQYLEHKYKDDKERLALEKAELIKKQGIPDMLGCLPLLLQIPIMIGLNRVLTNSIELYKAPFIFWIKDLSAPDVIVLPTLIGLGMIIQTLISPADARSRLSFILLGLIAAAFASNFSAGLTLYFAVSTWAGIIQTRIQKALK